jgi:hypothetical protein
MATITTTTVGAGNALPYPPTSAMDRNPVDNSLWIVFLTATSTIAVYKSTDGGVSWGSQGTFSATNVYSLAEMRIDSGGQHMHLCWLDNNGSVDRLIYKRIAISSGTADLSPGTLVVKSGGSGTPQAYLYGASLFPQRNPDGTFAVITAAAYHGTGASGWDLNCVSIKNDAVLTTYVNDNHIINTRHYVNSGNDTAITVSIDVEHNGDGIASTTPNLWICAQIFDRMYLIKLAWQGYKTGWTSPASATLIASGRSTVRDMPGRWDGSRYVMISQNPANLATLDVFERNQSNTSTTKRTTPVHPQGATIQSIVQSWNHITGDLRIFAVGGSAATVYYVDYIRATATWGAWTLVSATAPVTSEWSVRRGTAGAYQYDFYMTSGAGTPWTVSNVILGVNFAPSQPTWSYGTGTTPTQSGAAFDVSSSLTLDWVFNDPNTTDTQGTYALQRQIGAGTIQWWRTSDSTWQVTETQNASATTAVTLTTAQWLGAGGAADPAHVYKVRTWDAGGLPSAAYSAGLSIIPSTRVDPTLTAPTAAQILNSGIVTATWTVTEQASYRVTLTNVATGAVVSDSGFLSDPTPLTPSILSYDVPLVLPDGFSGSLTLQTRNAEGLTSVTRTVAFSVDFVEPVAPLITALASVPAQGGITVTVTQPAATGTQPATVQMDLWRRSVVTVTPTNANPTLEVNANDWTNVGYTSAVRSTAFAHSGVGSLLCTPTGAAATPYVQTTAIYPLTGGTRWEARGWFRSTTANKTVRMKLQWFDVGSSLISESIRDLTPVATVWIWGFFAAASPSTATGVRLAIGQIGTPAVGDTVYVDDMQLFAANDDNGIRINANVISGSTYLDWRTVTGTEYEYRGYAVAANSTAVYGPWQA